MMKVKLSLVLLLSILILAMCGKKQETIQITGWERYQDPYYDMGFNYPQGWTVVPEGGRFSVFSSPEVMNRFYDYTIKGKDGIRLLVSTQKMDTLQTLDQYVAETQTFLTNSGFDITATETRTLVDLPATQIQYGGYVDNENRIEVIQVVAIKDSNLYTVKYEAFNKLFEPYKMVLDTALATLELPQPKVFLAESDPSIPSAEFEKFENDKLSISFPDNFDATFPKPKAPAEFSMNIKGYRQDSNIYLDIIPAQGLTAEKVVEQNEKLYKELSRGTATIDGIQTTFINYSPVKDIQSRVYFLVKNDKIYRIITNYYAPMRSMYLPAFDKTLASIKIK